MTKKKLETLTPEQEQLLIRKRDEWIAIGRSTGPTDQAVVKEALSAVYREAGKEPPGTWIFLDGPLQGALASGSLPEHELKNGEAVEVSTKLQAEIAEIVAKVLNGEKVDSSAWHWPNFYGSQDGYYWNLSWYETMRDLGIEEAARLNPWFTAARNVGWCWLYWDVAIITDRPTILKVDDQGRLHCPDGPAVSYKDGLEVYAWHGTRIPKDWIENRENLDPKLALTHENIEQRRAAAEIITWAKVLATLDSTVIDKDEDPEIGELIRVDLPDSPGSMFLRVQCATKRTFCLPVPVEMKTARQANAWTWGLEGPEYKPEVRT
jgi:hypothetical protein